MSARPLRIFASVTATLALVAGGVAATTATAHADPNTLETPVDSDICPGISVWTGGFDAGDLGQHVQGKTTVLGTTIDTFDGTYLGTDEDPFGNEIYVFDLTGSRITKSDGSIDAGIWAGISGSPVYDDAGNLVGSVSYGFTGLEKSNTAGITPAKNIFETDTDITPSSAKAFSISPEVKSAARSAGNPVGSTSKWKQLSLPRVTVGDPDLSSEFANKSRVLAKRNAGKDTQVGQAALAPGLDSIEPGGNIGTSWSYGDIPLVAVGTVTAVCEYAGGDRVYAFGHPDENTGRSTQTFLSASTTTIISDGAYSYKKVNIDPVPEGPLVQDGNNGVVGVLGGDLPHATQLSTSTTGGRFPDQTHTTQVTTPYALPTAVGIQAANELYNAFKNNGPGEALMTWTIGYTPVGGSAATYTRTQRISSTADFAGEAGYEVASDVEFLQNASQTEVRIDSVDVTTAVAADYKALRISQVDYRKNHAWVKIKSGSKLPAKRGSKLALRVSLTPSKGSSAVAITRQIDYVVPKTSMQGAVSVSGGYSFYDDEEFFMLDSEDDGADDEFFDEEGYYEEDLALTVPEVLKLLNSQRRSDSVRGSYLIRSKYGIKRALVDRSVPSVTTGFVYLPLKLY